MGMYSGSLVSATTNRIPASPSGQFIQIDWNWYLGHSPNWHTGAVRISYASGGSYSTAYGLGNDCGWGTMSNNSSQGHGDSFSGTAWVAAANTSAHTFKFQHNGGGGGAPGIHLNNREDNAFKLTNPSHFSGKPITECSSKTSTSLP